MARLLIAFVLAFIASFDVAALSVGNPRIPDTGLWWVPGENGRFLHLDVGPDGYVFATVSGFARGTATYLVMQGPLELAPIDEAREPPVIGTLSSPLYEVAGGACFDCAWREPVVRPSVLGSGTLTFFASDELTLTAFGRTTTFRRFPLYSTPEAAPTERHVGRWLAVLRTSSGVVRDVVDIARSEGALTFQFPQRPQPGVPSPAESSLAPCGTSRIVVASDGALRGSSFSGLGCQGVTYVFNERDGALYGQRRQSLFADRIASEVLLYRVPPRWLADAASQSVAPGNARLPDPGLWWVEGRNGTFLHLDVGPDGYVFATLAGFADGVASYVVMQGPMQLEPIVLDGSDQAFAMLASPLYAVSGGSCFGCAWRAPSVATSAFGSGTLRFRRDRIELDAFGTTTTFRRFPLYTTEAASVPDRYAGRWVVLLRTIDGILSDYIRLDRFEDRLLVQPIGPSGVEHPSAASFAPCNTGWFIPGTDGTLAGLSSGGFRCVLRTYVLHERDSALYGQLAVELGGSEHRAREVLLYRVPDDW